MTENKIIIRQAKRSDVEGIAYVQYHSWLTTYTGIFPDDYIRSRTPESRIEHLKKNWKGFEGDSADYPNRKIIVAENENSKIVGFVAGGEVFHKEQSYDCEMYAFYILQEYQKQGIGTQLYQEMLKFLKTCNYRTMVIWVLKENPACIFYEKIGGLAKDSMIDQREGKEYQVVGYVWDDIRQI